MDISEELKGVLREGIRKASTEIAAERKTIELIEMKPCEKFVSALLSRHIFNTITMYKGEDDGG